MDDIFEENNLSEENEAEITVAEDSVPSDNTEVSNTEEIQPEYSDTAINKTIDSDAGNGENIYVFAPPQTAQIEFKESEKEPTSKGLIVFIVILSAAVLIAVAAAAGYFIGIYNGGIDISGKDSDISNIPVTLELNSIPEDKDEFSAKDVYSAVNPSVVGVTVYNDSGNGGMGAGIIYSEDGYIITNDHLFDSIKNPKLLVTDSEGNEYKARYIAGDTRSDIAVLKIETDKLTPAVFGDSSECYVGQNVVTIGRADSTEENNMTKGIISLKERRVSVTTNYSMKFIQVDAPTSPGSSGGALINMYGQVIGITSSKAGGDGDEGIAFAIPSTTVKKVVESLISYGYVVNRAKLGISYYELNTVTAEINEYDVKGLMIATIDSESDLYGKAEEGEIITHINGTEILYDDIVLDLLEELKPDDTVELKIVTLDGKTKTVTVKLLPDNGTSKYTEE